MDDQVAAGLEPVDSIDDVCLGIRKAYIKHLYNNEVTLTAVLWLYNLAHDDIPFSLLT